MYKKFKNVLLKESKSAVILYDHRDWGAVTIDNCLISRANVADVDFLPHLCTDVSESSDCDHVVVHESGLTRAQLKTNIFGETSKNLIFLQVSTSGNVKKNDSSISSVWLEMKDRSAYLKVECWLTEFCRITFDDARSLLGTVSREVVAPELEKKYTHLLDIILPHTIESRLAFSLLCEAWCLTHGGSEPTSKGVMIHAPNTPNDWFGPFGKKPGKDAAKEIAKLMGMENGIKQQVEEMLCSVYDEKLSWPDAQDQEKVKSLCAELKKATR